MTNFERIKAMDKKEMADFLDDFQEMLREDTNRAGLEFV